MRRLRREWWVVTSLLHVIALSGATCPPSDIILPCRCSIVGEDTQIWCSYSNLPSVTGAIQQLGQNLHTSVDEMILEGNNLPSLPGRYFEGLQVARLMLRDNGLERVTSNWLATLEPALQELYVIEPRMRTLPPDVLDHLRRLEAVTLQAGLMKRAPRFSSLPKLRYVQIQSPVLMDISPENFEDLPSLEQLHIVGSPLLHKLDAGFLRNLAKLSHIDISNCSLSWLHPKTFLNLPGVREVSLIWNRLSDAGVVGRACREFRNLQILRLDNNFIDRLIEGSFVDLPSLRELYLSGNMISEIHGGAFRNTPSLKIIDLNKNLLRRVNAAAFLYPSGSSLEELWLIDNQLHQVNELKGLFNSLPRLRFIDMSKNQMEELPFDVLRGHPTLERLHLNENRIKRLPKKAFAGMASLRELRLRNNSIAEYPDAASWNLPSLKGLDLSQNKFRRLDARLMTYLPSLRRLDLSENFIDTVLPDTFVGNLDLETINLSKNFITSFHALTFSHLPKLYELDASWNRLREVIGGLPRDIEYLRLSQNQIFTLPAPPTGLDLPHLRLLDLSGNALQILHHDTFRTMSRLQFLYLNDNLLQALEKGSLNGLSRLEVLNIRNNRLRDISNDYFKGLKGLKEINLQGNYLEVVNSGILGYSPKLETVRLGNNKISEIQPGAFSNSRELQELNLTHNFLDRFPEALQGLKMLRSLDMSHNNVRSVQPFLFESLPSLMELRLAHNKLYDLTSNSFTDLQKLEYLDMSNNEIENLAPRSVASLPSLIALQLGGNRLTSIGEEAFMDLPELESMDLQSNHLQDISNHAFVNVPHLTLLNLSHNLLLDVDKAGVRELRSLEVLDLSDNKVASIDGSNLMGLDWLVELRMDHNMICYIHGAPFNELPRLRMLSLRHNRMTSVSETAFQQLRNNIAVLDIDGNPLSCSCRMLWLQAWLQDSTSEGPHCRDGSLLRDARLSRTDCAHSRIMEPVVPGCEEQNVRGPTVEALQIKHNNVSLPHSMNLKAPETQETEYVYDEYVEYEEVNGTDTQPTFVPVDVTAGEMKASPHLTTGDTPTIYAQKPPKLNLTNPGLGYEDLKKAQFGTQTQKPPAAQGGYNGLSFFGIPLPSLSLGNIWRGRSTEASPYKRGKVQPVNPSARHRSPNFVTLTPKDETTENYPPYVTPAKFETGFVPMERSTESPLVEHSFPSHTALDRPTKESPPALPSTTGTPPTPPPSGLGRPFQLPNARGPPPMLLSRESSPDFFIPTPPQPRLPEPSPTAVDTPTERPTPPSQDLPSSNLPLEHRTEDLPIPRWETKPVLHPGKIEPVTLKKDTLLEPPAEEVTIPIETSSGGEEFFNSPVEEFNSSTRSRHISENSVDSMDRLWTEQKQVTPEEPATDPDSNSWYFRNYNKTNLQPFVERTFTTSTNTGTSPVSPVSLCLLCSALMLLIGQ